MTTKVLSTGKEATIRIDKTPERMTQEERTAACLAQEWHSPTAHAQRTHDSPALPGADTPSRPNPAGAGPLVPGSPPGSWYGHTSPVLPPKLPQNDPLTVARQRLKDLPLEDSGARRPDHRSNRPSPPATPLPPPASNPASRRLVRPHLDPAPAPVAPNDAPPP
ncbi:MAG: hypothetical protein R3F14_28105 [Polyangiaceae bacterium]